MITVHAAGVDYCAYEYNDRLYIVAVNTSHSMVNARISITDRAAISKRIKVLFENREIELTGNSFVDTFTAFEPHVYEFLPTDGSLRYPPDLDSKLEEWRNLAQAELD